MNISAIIAAAGSGSRLGREKNKILLNFRGKPMLGYSLELFSSINDIKQIIIVAAPGEEEKCSGIAASYCGNTPYTVVKGGKERMNSVFNGLKSVNKNCDHVMIHDGARPCLDRKTLMDLLNENFEHGAILAMPAKETIKLVHGATVAETIPRDKVFFAQTPQIFKKEVLVQGYKKAIKENFFATDDASVAEYGGAKINVVLGNENNIKITTPKDWEIAEKREDTASMRMGMGYDVHCFAENRDLILCGEKIDHDKGLLGHSDADVSTHALMDAILGAMAKGDIGTHFPPTDMEYKNANSLELLKKVCLIMGENNYELINADITIIAEKPKMAPHIMAMRENISKAMNVALDQISIKATTTEKLGFVGREQGIAAQATALIKSK
ncbi:MAG: 2-C-methyl-D-erythritol 4-phosphate cytidylyltransferase [Clostridiales bacterium]